MSGKTIALTLVGLAGGVAVGCGVLYVMGKRKAAVAPGSVEPTFTATVGAGWTMVADGLISRTKEMANVGQVVTDQASPQSPQRVAGAGIYDAPVIGNRNSPPTIAQYAISGLYSTK